MLIIRTALSLSVAVLVTLVACALLWFIAWKTVLQHTECCRNCARKRRQQREKREAKERQRSQQQLRPHGTTTTR